MSDKEKFTELKTQLEAIIKKLNLISVREAADKRGVTRSAILQLIQRGRLNTETIIGKTLVYGDEITNFQNKKPGPLIDTMYKLRKYIKAEADWKSR